MTNSLQHVFGMREETGEPKVKPLGHKKTHITCRTSKFQRSVENMLTTAPLRSRISYFFYIHKYIYCFMKQVLVITCITAATDNSRASTGSCFFPLFCGHPTTINVTINWSKVSVIRIKHFVMTWLSHFFCTLDFPLFVCLVDRICPSLVWSV